VECLHIGTGAVKKEEWIKISEKNSNKRRQGLKIKHTISFPIAFTALA